MVQKTPWLDRRFEVSLPLSMFPNVLERLRCTPARLEDRTIGSPVGLLQKRVGESWSIQETIGHLILAEALWRSRVENFIQREESLRPVKKDEQNRSYAEFNIRNVAVLLARFREAREKLVRQLEELSEDDLAHTAIHPRLNRSMRILDLMVFIAEHDDHHLATISELLRDKAE